MTDMADRELLTVESANTWRMKEDSHYNGGAVFFAYLHRCIEQPRLTRYDRYERKDRSTTSTWAVDGVDRASLADAILALNSPPVFTDAELAELTKTPEEFTDIRKTRDYELNAALQNKGAVEWQKGKCRRTELGNRAAAAIGKEMP